VTNNGVIVTTGAYSRGIFAQSVGGGGGTGGSAGGLLALGGSGSTGGDAGTVTVVNNSTGSITTTGFQSDGIFAQSVGGSGGSASNANGLVAVGGHGSQAGDGKAVTVDNYGTISTSGNSSRGLVAESIGGGGGDGGSTNGLVAVGGKGAGGGNSATVSVTHGGTITTQGADSTGLFAQSVGGGGGNGGSAGSVSAFAGVVVGGSGGGGGTGGDVNLTLQGEHSNSASVIRTAGDRSAGIVAQSVGGGGGSGGGAVQVTGGIFGAASVTVGGTGGAGGAGGSVNVTEGAGASIVETAGNDAMGLLLQSVGGGGGNGGYAIAAAASAGPVSGSLGVAVGGKGDTGGDGGTVNVGSFTPAGELTSTGFNGSILTRGDRSSGLIAQSVGGGGGNGGLSIGGAGSASLTVDASVTVSVGGDGAGGGHGGSVSVGTRGDITTQGAESTGMLVQSVGGGGGNGGGTVAVTLSGSAGGSGGVTVGVGGSAGNGGDGGTVTAATRSGTITTVGESSTGILVQSVGGGGGNGGFSVAGSAAGAGIGGGGVSVGLGGASGGGGTAGAVRADLQSDVNTAGENSTAILVQSVGGGGGNGGFNVNAAASGAGTGSGAVTVGLGAKGGDGGDGGTVVASVAGDVSTLGNQSTGILAQSVGGGGGSGGFNVSVSGSGAGAGSGAVGVSLGGSGGGGGHAATVDLAVAGGVSTLGNNAGAVIAQSVGGGGGSGGFNVTVAGSGAGTGSGAVGVGLGGSGDTGGDAAAVTSTMTGDISTWGSHSTGLLVQSVGGGGGNGGFNVSAVISGAGTGSGAAAVGLGGSGGKGGSASSVVSTLTGNVVTRGTGATGVTAQSIGGGGGNGGFNVSGMISGAGTGTGGASVGIGGSGGDGGLASTVHNTVIGDVTTLGAASGGVLAQSVGGGGGAGGFNVSGAVSVGGTGSGAASVGLGGSGGLGGNGAAVTNSVTGNVLTVNNDAFGILAQSIGGGGGNGGVNITGAISAAKSGSGAIAVGIGGAGGGGGDASTVDNTVAGYVATAGHNSAGITTQSLGGGGGNGGLNVSGTITAAQTGSAGLAVGIGGMGGDGGHANNVTSTVSGGVLTLGESSAAILTQSLGGGGGNGGLNVSAALNLSKENGGALGFGLGGFGGGGGNAGDVTSTVTTTGLYPQIVTMGEGSSAVVAQSIGGGGGNGGLNVTGAVNLSGKSGAAIGIGVGGFGGGAGNAGNVVLNTTGDILTYGKDSNGLMAQSLGGGGGNGGINVTGALSVLKPSGSTEGTTVAASIGVGGFGGGGGAAGNVDVTYQGTIATREAAHGLVAQSLGGGGGNGGINVSGGVSYAAGEADGHGLLVGVGGFGGGGGNAGNVNVNASGTSITAAGDGRSGIFASSIGGGGGAGGLNVSGGIVSDSPLIVGIGGLGGDGGTGGHVSVTAVTDLFTSSQAANGMNGAGLMAQSLGGGGGNGGLNVSGGISLGKEADVPSITFGIGGFGGAGAVSGNVDVAHTGSISTSGGWTHGIFAQSLAGGGGNGALNVTGEFNWADSKDSGGKKDLSIVAGLGGHGGAGADAGTVNVVANGGTIATSGDYARGIFAQSVGGGGGTGGMNVTGVFAKNSSPVMLGVGGFGSGGGHAGSVLVTRGTATDAAGRITTDGIGAIGIEASSIGGGGGDAGMNFVLGISLAGSGDGAPGGSGGSGGSTPRKHPKHTGVDESVFTNYDKVLDELEGKAPKDSQDSKDASKGAAFAAQVVIGGGGGEAGNGGIVSVTNRSAIATRQDSSHGILAQSIGGGGGNASLNIGKVYEGTPDKNTGVNLALGGGTGDGGVGSDVTVVHEGDIETRGKNSYGVLAQSIGGGGGNVGLDYLDSKTERGKFGMSIGRFGGTGGSGGNVSLTADGNIMTYGSTSYGLLAQSIGNGGGNSSAFTVSVEIPETEKKDDKKNENTDGKKEEKENQKKKNPPRGGSLSVGLEGGEGGFGGNVELHASGAVITRGKDSHAIFAQSVGGGGGNGGDADATDAETVAVAVGGAGGQGGVGGNVTVTSSAQVRTYADQSVGILAQSVGGGGGTAGEVKGGIKSKGHAVAVSVGGSGGEGMSSAGVSVVNTGVIITNGADSHGVLAQSIGGGGGNASVLTGSVERADPDDKAENSNKTENSAKVEDSTGGKDSTKVDDPDKKLRIGVSVGGNGGTGATAGRVTVRNSGGVGTTGPNSVGIFAQSIGGGGGNASEMKTSATSKKGPGITMTLGVGGTGGTGAAGGDVTVVNERSGEIITVGDYSPGILAMSVGGGGGTGSSTTTTNEAKEATAGVNSMSVAVSLGGDGGSGGTGGIVEVTNAGAITTYGYKSHGIVAQSIGGGGGNAGVSTSEVSIGGTSDQSTEPLTSAISVGGAGGDGNRAGHVIVTNSGSIVVNGNNAYGIYAQSVGGGGGDGGIAAAGPGNQIADLLTDPVSSLLNIGVGGNGGTGGDGGNVLVTHTGSITSYGDHSYGIFAQSVGGGGGSVGTSTRTPIWNAVDLGISAVAGGRDGAAGQAGTVTVNTTGDISMFGANSQAQFIQAVSGGGGDLELFLDVSRTAVDLGKGGFTLPNNEGIVEKIEGLIEMGSQKVEGATGVAIDATHVGSLYTWGDKSIGSLVQSVGGGGGNAGSTMVLDEGTNADLDVALGAKHTNNSSGGDVSLDRTGDVQTAGSQSQGVSVQSVGGGGGRVLLDVKRVAANTTSSGASTSTATVGLGADPSYENHGGNLDLDLKGNTVTLGNYSPGLVLQSIGAGGGQAYLGGLASATVNIGAADGSTGDGGNILLSNTGAIATFGELSDGIVLQSIGGGGGYVITDVAPGSVTVNTRGHNAGDGGRITFTQLGNIIVSGDRSRGVIAQSIGGGGGLVDGVFSGAAGGLGAGGSIDLQFEGDVVASGLGSSAIIAESLGRSAGDISISLAPGRVVLGGIGGTGVAIGGGMNNSLLNRSVLTTMSGVEGMTIAGTTGNDAVQNFGTIIGSIGLGGGHNTLNNHSAGWLASGTSIDLGGGTFTNAGTLDPGARSLLTTSVNGNFVQHGTPTWLLDIGEAGHSDRLSISGRADFSNSATTIDLFGGRPVMASGSYTLLETGGGLSGAEFNLGTLIGEMPIGQTFSLQASDSALELNLQPSTGTFYWNGTVSNVWNEVFVNGRSNWTRQPDSQYIFGTPGAASDVIVDGDAVSVLGADFTIGSLSGSGLVALGGKVLTTGANGASTMWAGTLGGDGGLVKTGAGTFTLSGINPMTGVTTVAGGKLLVNGWLTGSSVQVQRGAQLGGVGVVPSVTIASGGILTPGRSIGTLVVDGDLTFESGSTYLVETTFRDADLTWATGSLFGSGATVHVQPGGDERYRPITSYGIIRAEGADAGLFSNVVSDAAYLDPSLQYGAEGVYLTLRRNDVDFRSTGTRGNQTAVAGSLNGLVRTATGDMAAVINNVYDLTNADAVQAMGSMSGVLHQHAASSAFLGAQMFIDTNMSRLAHVGSGGGSPIVNPALGSVTIARSGGDRQGAWFSGIGGFTRLAARDGDSPARVSDHGFAVGYDAMVGDHLVVGASGGESKPDLEIELAGDLTSSRMRHLGAYGRYARAGSRLSLLGGVTTVKNDSARLVSDGVSFSSARAAYEGSTPFTRVEYGYTFSLGGNLSLEPQAGLQAGWATIDGFTEEGAGVLNLVVRDRRVGSQRSFLGGRAVRTFNRSNAADTQLEVRAAWTHEFNPLGAVRVRFLGDGAGNGFDLKAPAQFANGAVVGATFAGQAFTKIKFLTSVDGTFSGAVRFWTASVGIRGEW
jgi:hypothetical protein